VSQSLREAERELRSLHEDIRSCLQLLAQAELDLKDISQVKMQNAPHDPALHYEVGVIAMRAGAVEEGLRWLHSALKETPTTRPPTRPSGNTI
jgi:hypothetical protein